ncbi:hypothetical protein GCM10009861_06080 [Neomicrococcus aestuarii]
MWWRRWSAPREFVMLYMDYPDGQFDDAMLDEEELDDEIDSWERGEFSGQPYRNEEPTRYRLEWLSDDETSRVRANFV